MSVYVHNIYGYVFYFLYPLLCAFHTFIFFFLPNSLGCLQSVRALFTCSRAFRIFRLLVSTRLLLISLPGYVGRPSTSNTNYRFRCGEKNYLKNLLSHCKPYTCCIRGTLWEKRFLVFILFLFYPLLCSNDEGHLNLTHRRD